MPRPRRGLLLLAQEQDSGPDLLWGQAGRGGASPLGTAADGRKDGEGGAGQDSAGGVLASTGDSIPQVTCSETQQDLPEPAGDRPRVPASYL